MQGSTRAWRGALERACDDHDAPAAFRALIAWGAQIWPGAPPSNLRELAARLEHGGEEIQALNRALYGAGAEPWNGDELWRALRRGLLPRKAGGEKARNPLPPLYPSRT